MGTRKLSSTKEPKIAAARRCRLRHRGWSLMVLTMVHLILCSPIFGGTGQRQGETQGAVRCFLVVPPGEEPWPDAQDRLDMVLKDIQWWYSCQMEAHGYGAKSFPVELDQNGRVRINLVRLAKTPAEGENKRIQFQVQKACLDAARKAMGTTPRNTVMAVVYNGHIWRNRKAHSVWPCGTGAGGKWAFITGWHYHSICPAAWHVGAELRDYENPDGYFPNEHVEILRGHYTYRRSTAVRERWLRRPVGLHAVMGHGTLAHELGHAFGLQHRKSGEPMIHKSVMQQGYVHMRGNFLEKRGHEACCLTALDAAKLNKNPLFQTLKLDSPSTGASRAVGMRGAKAAIEAAGVFAYREYAKRGPSDPKMDSQGTAELGDLEERLVGTWVLSDKMSKAITFLSNGTVTASYDDDKSRRWRRNQEGILFTKGSGKQKVIFFADYKAMRMGNNVWIKLPSLRD